LKKAFTLFEIMITIILISILYIFAINNFSKGLSFGQNNINFENLKTKLISYEFDDKITIKCIEDDFSCFVFVDDQIQDSKIKPFFKDIPTIYNYSKDLERIELLDLELEQLQNYNVVFEYSCTKEQRCDEMIVEMPNKIYIFNDIHKGPIVVQNLSDVDEYFESKIREVKDAF
jgi:prepilin-type N-terminal cleavage/methylation domain-containing protein